MEQISELPQETESLSPSPNQNKDITEQRKKH